LSVKLEIINNFVRVCREFLSFEEEKKFDWMVAKKSVEIFNETRAITTKDTKVHEGSAAGMRAKSPPFDKLRAGIPFA